MPAALYLYTCSRTSSALPAKQFDLLILNAQLQLLNQEGGFGRLQTRIISFASALEGLANVPMVAREMELILDIQTDGFWETDPFFSSLEKRIRDDPRTRGRTNDAQSF